ncbi:MAG: flippase-like domain-containing protein [Clostridia bacterium]|nr:flippase-like domain-containing protein [Clostridia bacterium]
MKKRYKLLFFILGLAGLAVMIWRSHPGDIDWSLLVAPPIIISFVIQIVIWLAIFAVHVFVYRVMLGREDAKKVGFFRLSKIVVSGFALNNVTPAGLVGGEPYRIMELRQYCGTEKALSATLNFSVFYVMGHVMLWFTGSVLYFVTGCPGGVASSVGLAVAGLLCFLGCVFFIRHKSTGLIVPVFERVSRWHIPLVSKYTRKQLENKRGRFSEVDRQIAAFSSDRRKFYSALLLEYFSRLLESLEYYVILVFLGAAVNPVHGILVLSLASLIGNLLFMIPMQAGTREGGMGVVLGWIGVSSETGILAALLYRLREFLCIAVGIILILIDKKKKKKAAETTAVADDSIADDSIADDSIADDSIADDSIADDSIADDSIADDSISDDRQHRQ